MNKADPIVSMWPNPLSPQLKDKTTEVANVSTSKRLVDEDE